MGRRPSRMSLDGGGPRSAEKKAREYAKKKPGLLKKARELATLCAVPIAIVASLPGGGVPDDVWESEEGVLARYCALPAEKRAGHSHARYLEEQLGKDTAKLARMRQDGPKELQAPDSMLGAMTLDELRGLLEDVDAALLATAERRKALGLPADDEDDTVEPRGHGVPCTGGNSVGFEGYQMQPPINANVYDGRLNQAMFDTIQPYADMLQPGYYNTRMVQPPYNAQYIGGTYAPQQMQGNGNNHHGLLAPGASFQPPNAVMQPTDGCFRFTDFCNFGYQMPMQGNGNAVNGFPRLEMWRTDEPRNDAIVPAGYPYIGMSSNCMGTPVQYAARANGGNFINTPVGYLGIGTGGNVANYVDGYETQCSSNEFQYSGSTSRNSSSIEELQYLNDVADTKYSSVFGGAQLQRWENQLHRPCGYGIDNNSEV